MHQYLINASLQLLPIVQIREPYKWIDEVIEIIQKSGLKYDLNAFATVVEGKYDEVMELINNINEYLYVSSCDEWILNVQIQLRSHQSITIAEKVDRTPRP